MKALSPFALVLLCVAPAFASVSVSSPLNGATVTSPFSLIASASPCSSQAISAMGYSLDNSSTTTIVKASSISASVSATTGGHVLHVKSWGTSGASCIANVSITVATALVPTSTSTTTTNVVVTAPLSGSSVSSPFAVIASGTLCSGQAITAMGYSLDNSSSTVIVNGTALNGSLSASAGSHTVHIKSWGKSGASCVSNIPVSVATLPPPPTQPSTSTSGPSIPSNAVAQKAIQNLTTWTASYDAGTSGSASGAMSLVTSPALSGSARKFVTNYTNYGGERYNIKLATDQTSTNFVYDTNIYLASGANDIANIEMDLNQVMSNGQTVIYGFQCDGWSHTWDFTQNTGTPTSPNDKWIHSNQPCDPQKLSTNAWHHVQISYSRDSSGNVTYHSVWLDGVQQDLNVTVGSAFALGWGPSVNANFQIDGMTSTSGSSTVLLDNFTLYSW